MAGDRAGIWDFGGEKVNAPTPRIFYQCGYCGGDDHLKESCKIKRIAKAFIWHW